MFSYKVIKQKELKEQFDAYLTTLTGPYDDYLENHILDSTFYEMKFNRKRIGYFAIYKESLLTQFYVVDEWLHLAQGCFKTIIETFKIKQAYVPTCDEFMLSLSMDFHKKMTLQAYIFESTERDVDPAAYPKSMLRLASLSDTEQVKSLSGDFFKDLYQMISDRKIYILEDEEIYGFGVVENNRIHTKFKGTGMFTVEKHRHKGVGRSIILHLKDLVETLGYEALPACWYHNYDSKRTLESCGFVSKRRLIKIEF